MSLQPRGLTSRIANFTQWRGHIVTRLEHQIEVTGDRDVRTLLAEVASYPVPQRDSHEQLEH